MYCREKRMAHHALFTLISNLKLFHWLCFRTHLHSISKLISNVYILFIKTYCNIKDRLLEWCKTHSPKSNLDLCIKTEPVVAEADATKTRHLPLHLLQSQQAQFPESDYFWDSVQRGQTSVTRWQGASLARQGCCNSERCCIYKCNFPNRRDTI